MIELRPYQAAAIQSIEQQFCAGKRRALLVLPTGCGKTVVFAELTRRLVTRENARVLVLAHRKELIHQAVEKLAIAGVKADIEQADKRARRSAEVVVASVQTMRGKRLESWERNAFSLIVVDEAHHSTSDGYCRIFERFNEAQVLGVTATPDRLDGVGLGEIFETVAFSYNMKQATDDGYLVPIVAKRIAVASVDLDEVQTRAGDFAVDELSEVMRRERALHSIAVPIVSEIGERLTIAFAVDIQHAHALADAINHHRPGFARALDGTMPSSQRAALIAGFLAREFQVLVNVAIMTEGVDLPEVSCVAMSRPTKSRALYTQCLGRAVRLFPGKESALALDFYGNSQRHRLIGPVDCLAGTEPEMLDSIRDELEQVLAERPRTVDDAITEAKERYAHRRIQAVVDYAAVEIDPYVGKALAVDDLASVGLTLQLDLDQRQIREDRRPVSEVQRAQLARWGLKNIPEETTMALASQWLASLIDRSKKGHCTIPQARLLAQHGYKAHTMSFQDASDLIGRLKRARSLKGPGW